ncbi:MAG: DUF4864 domain-containing protein [Pseudomonadota bacterium]
MRIVLFLSCLALSAFIAFTSLSDVRAESQAVKTENAITQNISVDYAEPVHAIIEKQLRAFREKDAERAYKYNSSTFQSRYRDEEHFLTMMRLTYNPLTSHKSYSFLDQSEIGDTLIQKVSMVNKDGSSVIMMVYLKQNERGTWMIDGYTLLDSEDAQPI